MIAQHFAKIMDNLQNGKIYKIKTNGKNISRIIILCLIDKLAMESPEMNLLRDEFNLQRARMKEIYLQKDRNYEFIFDD